MRILFIPLLHRSTARSPICQGVKGLSDSAELNRRRKVTHIVNHERLSYYICAHLERRRNLCRECFHAFLVPSPTKGGLASQVPPMLPRRPSDHRRVVCRPHEADPVIAISLVSVTLAA